MCGRFVSTSDAREISEHFEVDEVSEQALAHSANHNTAPTSDVFVVYSDGSTRRLDTFHWGLVPSWAKDTKIASRLINARAETVAEKPSFRSAFKRRRCILPVDGFYEWNKLEGAKRKQPWYIHRPDGEPYAFAGLWEEWRGHLPTAAGDDDPQSTPGGEEVTLRSSTIITGAANEKMSQLHHRMPIILPADAWTEWLDPATDTARLQALLVPAPDRIITFHPVSTEVNNARNKGEHLTDEVELDSGAPEEAQAASP